MLATNELHEVVEPALYLVVSGLPLTNEALIVTDEHMKAIERALLKYRHLTNAANASETNSALESVVQKWVQEIKVSRSIGLSRLLNSFYFNQASHPDSALQSLREEIIADTYVSPGEQEARVVIDAMTRAT